MTGAGKGGGGRAVLKKVDASARLLARKLLERFHPPSRFLRGRQTCEFLRELLVGGDGVRHFADRLERLDLAQAAEPRLVDLPQARPRLGGGLLVSRVGGRLKV